MAGLLSRQVVRVNLNAFRRSTTQQATNVAAKTAEAAANTAAKAAEAKPTMLKRFKKYLENIYLDYKDVAVHTVKQAGEYPFKALGYGIFMSAMLVFYKKNPDLRDYRDTRKDYCNDMLMCGSTHSRRSHFYLNELNRLENLDQLEYKSFVFFSLIMVKKFSGTESTYEKNCTQLNSPNKYNIFNLPNTTLRFVSRIIDIGFCDEWYFLNKNMKDYDVSELEWQEKKPVQA
jgi:hypothetical protein